MSQHSYGTRSRQVAGLSNPVVTESEPSPRTETLLPRNVRLASEGRQTEISEFFTTRSRGSSNDSKRVSQPPPQNATEAILERLTSLLEIQSQLKREPTEKQEVVKSIRRPEAKAPDTFDGQSATALEDFLSACEIIFLNHESSFRNGRDKVIYASSFLKDSAQRWFRPIMTDPTPGNETIMESWSIFVDALRKQFGDPNRIRTAEFQLSTLYMKSDQYISHYITRFRLLASELKDWDDAPLRFAFRRGLPERILDELARVDQPNHLSDLMEACQRIDHRYWERQKERKLMHRPSGKDSKDSSKSSDRNSGSSENSTEKRNNGKKGKRTKPQGNKPNANSNSNHKKKDLDKVLTKDGKLTAEEKQRRIDKGLCSYDGQPHSFENCPNRPKTNQSHGRSATLLPAESEKRDSQSKNN